MITRHQAGRNDSLTFATFFYSVLSDGGGDIDLPSSSVLRRCVEEISRCWNTAPPSDFEKD